MRSTGHTPPCCWHRSWRVVCISCGMESASEQRIEIIGPTGEVTVFDGDKFQFATEPFGMKFVFESTQTGELEVPWSEPLARDGVRGVITVTNPTTESSKSLAAAGLL